MRVAILELAGILLLTFSGGQTRDPVNMEIDDPEAYAVYASLIPQESPVKTAHATRLVVLRETGNYNECMPSGGPLDKDWRPVVESFKKQNATVRVVLSDRNLSLPYVVVPRAAITQLFNQPGDPLMFGWKHFYDRYPDSGGYMEFSAVGFDPSKTRAMVYVAHHCGSLCGGGAHHLLRKVDGRWQRERLEGVTQCIWMS